MRHRRVKGKSKATVVRRGVGVRGWETHQRQLVFLFKKTVDKMGVFSLQSPRAEGQGICSGRLTKTA